MLSRFVVAIVLSASLVTSALADDKPTKPTKPPQKGFASIKASDDHFVIRVSKPIHAKDFAGGFARLVLQKYEYRVPAGDYPVRFRSYADGREWFMIPMERWTGEFSGDATDVSEAVRGCPSRFTDYLAIDREDVAP
ncbi:MAG: hypothetical protein IPH76_10620 [Xanthomonadales bacterium]|nr:hypothetical protein [Xanthomonadales bacterium]